MSDTPTTIVTGFGRCGSTMVMHMLNAIDVPTIADSKASFESDLFRMPKLMDWDQFGGRAIKVLDPHRWSFPAHSNVRFIFLGREPRQQALSQAKLLQLSGIRATRDQVRGVERSLRTDYATFRDSLGRHPVLVLQFEHILAKPLVQARKIAAFLAGPLPEESLVNRMAAVVVSRRPECLPDLSFEFDLVNKEMAEVQL